MRAVVTRLPATVGSLIISRTPVRAKAFVGAHKLALAISGAILIALIQTIISVGMYVNSSTYGLDLSRPEFEAAKRQVEPNAPQTSFSSSGPINPETIDQFNKLYADQVSGLQSAGRYDGTPLGDAELRFTPETANTEPTQN